MKKKKTAASPKATHFLPLITAVLVLTLSAGYAAMDLYTFIPGRKNDAEGITGIIKINEETEQVIEIVFPAVEDLTDEKEILPEKLTVIPGGYLSSSEGLTYINVPDYYLTINDAVTSLDFNEYRMLLVNKEYSVPAEFDNSNHDAETALLKMDEMIKDAENDGISIWVQSGYRSYDNQAAIHARYHERYSEDYVDSISAEAGHSEHQTGMAFDMTGNSGMGLSTGFAGTEEFSWLNENAEKYGFILRFQEGKEWATGYSYEPWHFRYVGTELAKILNDSGLTVEEFIGQPWNPVI